MDTIIEAGMLALVNQVRAEHGLEATTLDALTDKDRETYRNRAEAVLYAIAPQIVAEHDQELREQIAARLDSEGHHWSGAPAHAFFNLAVWVREGAHE